MPGLRERRNPIVGKFTHLLTDGIERVVEPAGADRRIVMLAHQLHQPRPARRRVSSGDEMFDGRNDPCGNRRRV